MINATDKLFINSTNAVSSIPQEYKLIGEIPISEYIDFNSPEWLAFSYKESNKAYELYGPESAVTGAYACRLGIDNITYSIIGSTTDKVIKYFLNILNSLKVAAIATKLSGCEPGEGQLIFQCRTKITLHERTDGNIQLSWRGNLTRIPSEPDESTKRLQKEFAPLNFKHNPFVIDSNTAYQGTDIKLKDGDVTWIASE